MKPKGNVLKYMAGFIIFLLFISPFPIQAAEMEDYCVVPPYVKSDLSPNIMFLVDNSLDMLTAAYTDNYTPNATKDNYTGYFKPQACYRYTNKFEELYKSTSPDISYTASDTCPSSAPFRGNLMNWATTSKFDLLQKVIIGGNSVSKQGNAHTLLNITGIWTKTHGGCIFQVNDGNVTITEGSNGACSLLNSPATPIAFLKDQQLNAAAARSERTSGSIWKSVSDNLVKLPSFVLDIWNDFALVPEAAAAQLSVTNTTALNGTVQLPYTLTLEASGNNNCTYSWNFHEVPSWLSGPAYQSQGNRINNRASWTGTPSTAGTYTLRVTVSNNKGDTPVTRSFSIVIAPAPLTLTTASMPNGSIGISYSFILQATGGVTPYTWAATGLPAGLEINAETGEISGTPATQGSFSVTVTLRDATYTTLTRTYSMKIVASAGRSSRFSLRVVLVEEPLNDLNGNGIYDPGSNETYTDLNINGKWDGKIGVFQKYWDSINPRARWGLTKYTNQGVTIPSSGCIPVSPAASFYTTLQNAQPEADFPLASGLYGDINYYVFNGTGYRGCNNSDPIDDKICRKNFVLIMSSGANVSGTHFSQSNCIVPNRNNSAPLVQNACYGFKNDLRADKGGKQNVHTYVVNTLGTSSNVAILEDAAAAGNGKFYDARYPSELEQKITQAFNDILARAASGTAASVLASGEGQGANLVQAVFYPRTQNLNTGGIFEKEIAWIGRLTNLWYYVDPFFKNSNIREDTNHGETSESDKKLHLKNDYVARLYYDSSAEQTKAARWSDDDGDGDGDNVRPTVTLEKLKNIWEAGLELWKRNSSRTIYTTLGGGLIPFTQGRASNLRPYLQASDLSEAEAIIRYVHGEDNPAVGGTAYSFRERTVAIDLNGDGDTADAGEGAKVWKLGDILNSTPKISSWLPLNAYDRIYSDASYKKFLESSNYQNRGMVFAGGNDGMLHSFKLGKLELPGREGNSCSFGDYEEACLSNDASIPLGHEMWAFIPGNALPYLKYTASDSYCHVFTVDLTPYIFDASIGTGVSDISNNEKPNDGSTWRTILIGGMRFGGACRNYNAGCTDCVKTPIDGVGYSSYFALDITDQNTPVLLWEFSHPQLGFSTTGPAVVRIGSDRNKNGKWFVVLSSGPTGPIDTVSQQFLGRSDQNLRLFVLDLKTGTQQRTIDTGIQHAFAGSMLNSTHDADLDYQDDVIYVPYVKRNTTDNTWSQGGVGRLLTGENENPSTWVWSRVMDNIGPVTSAVVRLQHKIKKKLWLYFGTGRYYFEQMDIVDDEDGQRHLFGITEPCFRNDGTLDTSCTTSRTIGELSQVNVSSEEGVHDNEGWYVNLDCSPDVQGCTAPDGFRAERVITDPLSTTTGLVFFTTYKPYVDVCAYGGKSHIWAMKYDTGGAPGAMLKGTALLQVSTGSIEQVDLSSAFTEKSGRRTGALEGVPPTAQGLSIMTTPPPVKRVIHMRER